MAPNGGGGSGSSGGGWFGNLLGVGWDVARGIAGAGVGLSSSAISKLVTNFLKKTSSSEVLCVLRHKPEFYTFLESILPYIYMQICLRYIFPMLFILILPTVLVCWLWRTEAAEAAEKYNSFINSASDAVIDYTVRGCKACGRGIFCAFRHLKRLIGGGAPVKVESVDLSNLRNSVEQLSQDMYNNIEEIEEPVNMLFPTR